MESQEECPSGMVPGPYGQLVPGLRNAKWVVIKVGEHLMVFHGDATDMQNYRGSFATEEEKWQPGSIQICKDLMIEMSESNVAIFFEEKDIKEIEWENKELPAMRDSDGSALSSL